MIKPPFKILALGAALLASCLPAPAQQAVRINNSTRALSEPTDFFTANAAAISSAIGGGGGGMPVPEVKSANFTAVANHTYITTTNVSVTDPAGSSGANYKVTNVGGALTIGGDVYTDPGTTILRVYLGGSWFSFPSNPSGLFDNANEVFIRYNDGQLLFPAGLGEVLMDSSGAGAWRAGIGAAPIANPTFTTGITAPLVNATTSLRLYDATNEGFGSLRIEDGELYYKSYDSGANTLVLRAPSGASSNTAALDASGITGGKTFVFPNASGTVAVSGQAVSFDSVTVTDVIANNALSLNGNEFTAAGSGNTIDFPNSSGTVVLAAAAQTLTNKSIVATQLTGTLAVARLPALTGGDATTSAGSGAITLVNSGVTASTYKSVTVDAKGRVTAGTNPTTLSGYGISDAAPLASPTLSGTPAAPTAAADTNTTQIATTAFVVGQAGSSSPVVDGTAAAGSSLRYSRQDHVHPTDTSRAPLASPTFTGTPAAPTATAGANTTQIATTAFVATGLATKLDATPALSALTYASTLDLAFTAAEQRRSLTLTGNITFTGSNYADRSMTCVFITGDTVTRTIAFPANWKFVGTKPTEIAANKVAVLVLECTTGSDTGVFAAWAVQQ